MSKDTLEALAVRCEQATGPDRDLDGAIAAICFDAEVQRVTIGPDYRREEVVTIDRTEAAPISRPVQHFTASLDAAMTLVPDGYHPNQSGGDPSASDGGRFYVEMDPNNDSPDERRLQRGSGQTFALALCAAALRARATQPPSGASHA